MKYVCYIGPCKKGQATKFKGAIYPEPLKPADGEVVKHEFDAKDDGAALAYLNDAYKKEDIRSLSGWVYLPDCRDKLPSGNRKVPVCIDLTDVAPDLREKIHEALALVEPAGAVVRDGERYRVAREYHTGKPREKVERARVKKPEGEKTEVEATAVA